MFKSKFNYLKVITVILAYLSTLLSVCVFNIFSIENRKADNVSLAICIITVFNVAVLAPLVIKYINDK